MIGTVIALIALIVASPAQALEKEAEYLTKYRLDLMGYAADLLAVAPKAKTCEDIMAIYILEKQTDTIGAYFWGFATIYELRAALQLLDFGRFANYPCRASESRVLTELV